MRCQNPPSYADTICSSRFTLSLLVRINGHARRILDITPRSATDSGRGRTLHRNGRHAFVISTHFLLPYPRRGEFMRIYEESRHTPADCDMGGTRWRA